LNVISFQSQSPPMGIMKHSRLTRPILTKQLPPSYN